MADRSMRAARYYGAKDIRVEDLNLPQPSDDKVLVAVEWCGICGSDLNEYLLGPMASPSPKTGPHPLTGEMVPITLGHEISGRVIHMPSTSRLSAGQPVVIDPRLSCSSCMPCTELAANCCDKLGFVGLSGREGGLSSVVSVSPTMVHPLPDHVDLAAAALVEPLAVAWHAVKLSGIETQSAVPILVVGSGPVGVAIVFVLRAWKANVIIVSEPMQQRRKFLVGKVSAVIDPAEVDVGSKCRELTNGNGVGIVFDCAGSQDGFVAGCDSLRFGGKYINLAIPKAPLTIPMWHVMRKELTIRSSLAYRQSDFQETVAAFATGQFNGVEQMITSRVSLEEVVKNGFEVLTRPNDHIKIIVTPK